MKRSWFSILLVAGLLGLLVVLATLQYRWLGQISEREQEHLQSRLEADTKRFAEDFNREIQNAYFNFQLPASGWKEKNWSDFNERYRFWREKTAYPQLIGDFYFAEFGESRNLSRYDREKGAFEAAEWTEELNNLKPNFADEKNIIPVVEEIPALLMPVNFEEENIRRVMIRTAENPPKPIPVKRYGVLIIKLEPDVIKNQLLPNLVKEYFGASESANYKLAVVNQKNQAVFQTRELTAKDASAKLFDLSPDNFLFYANRELMSSIQGERKTMVFSKFESTAKKEGEKANVAEGRQSQFEVKLTGNKTAIEGEKPRIRVFDSGGQKENGVWTLNVQHTDGSLGQFITNARRKNLGISFGILSLLAVSIILIFLSAQRAKLLAQRQLDFVSSVSHEFRTPIAVIYSAGENLADGVTNEKEKVSRYGNLIKREGKKLSSMVEQILEFAGARSGKRKYDLRETSVEKVIEEAIEECQPMIDEKGFSVEKDIAENLPRVSADEKALTQAVQNLIANALKYSSGEKWLKITASNGGRKVKIAVEDKGIGIEKRELGKVFEPFYRSKSVVDEQIHGNGLGLSLVKQIVVAHGGKIEVESEIGKGSKFTIEIPQKD